MEKKLLLIIVNFIAVLALGQEYEYIPIPTENAIWSESYYPGIGNGDWMFERFAVNGDDTLINDTLYNKLYLFYDSVFNTEKATYIGAIREDTNKKVYFKGGTPLHEFKPMNGFFGNNEIVLYDFSVEIGDTIYGSNVHPGIPLIVEKIDNVTIKQSHRKVISFTKYSWVKWIEGIGNLRGLLFNSSDLPTNGTWGDLICFNYMNETIYYNEEYTECFPKISNVKENGFERELIKIYPQPALQVLNIEFSESISGFIYLYSKLGQLLYCNGINNKTNYQINIQGFRSGFYLLKIRRSNGMLFTHKIIIE